MMATVKGVTILVVDNDVTVLQKVEKVLKKSGYEVEVATDGALAINRALASLPDIVVSAVEMPLLDGFKLCQLLRTNPISRDIPFVFLTSKEDRAVLLHGGGGLFDKTRKILTKTEMRKDVSKQ